MFDRRATLRGPRRQLVFELTDAARLLRSYIESVAVSHGTTRAQWGLLAVVRGHEGVSQAELAAEMGLAPISLARLIDRTQAEGFIERRAHETDRRINRLFLTRRGRAAVDGLDHQREAIAADVLAALDPAEIAAVTQALAKIAAQIRQRNCAVPAGPAAKPNKVSNSGTELKRTRNAQTIA